VEPLRLSASQIRHAELIDESLRRRRLVNDSVLVILTNRARQLVVVHRRTVLALAPQLRQLLGIFDLEQS